MDGDGCTTHRAQRQFEAELRVQNFIRVRSRDSFRSYTVGLLKIAYEGIGQSWLVTRFLAKGCGKLYFRRAAVGKNAIA